MTHTQTQSAIRSASSIRSEYESLKKRNIENSNRRMENYYNCIDDYSWGGICDQAATEMESRMNSILVIMEEQEANGGYIIREVERYILTDMDGNELSDKIVNGQYGRCWIIKNDDGKATFVSVPKKLATLAKKGYQIKCITYTMHITYNGRLTSKGNKLIHHLDIVNSIDCIIDQSKYSEYEDNNEYNTFMYFNPNK